MDDIEFIFFLIDLGDCISDLSSKITGVLSVVLLDETMVLSEASFFSSDNLLLVSFESRLSLLVSKDDFSDLTPKVARLL